MDKIIKAKDCAKKYDIKLSTVQKCFGVLVKLGYAKPSEPKQ